ncbi:MAG: ABC transporter ATP-binding protein [Chloroflexota bacterium]|nr:ABC transporter ATP-binding protein [Chloroflexota bacterium]MDE2685112.1 ABC transporter ATP-binding protein [Chloroflexota bacterium]
MMNTLSENNQPPAVTVSGLSKHFGRVRAVDDVTLTIPAGGVYGLLGPNGSGKTTLLSMLTGFLHPTAGTISLLGETGSAGQRAARRHIGTLIERPTFWPYLSCRDNLRCLQGIYASHSGDGEIEELLATVNLDGDAATRKFRACSTGMKQRLGIAATLLGNPSLLILDEPTNGLDPAGIVEVRELIRDLAGAASTGNGKPRTIILASHLLNEVEQVCDHVGVMARGKLLYSGPLSEMGTTSAFGRVHICTTDNERAANLLSETGWELIDQSEDGLDVAVTPGREWEISRDLANVGVYIAELRPLSGSLEAGFMSVTGESGGDNQ